LQLVLLCASAFAATPEQQITIVYDNTAALPDFYADWGFSAVVDFQGRRVLFDAGSKSDIFLHNLKQLGIDKSSIQSTIISHEHTSHSGGFYKMLPAGLVYFLDGFSKRKPPAQLGPGIYSTGDIEGSPPEQALVIETSKGLVVLVSCAHPGIGRMVATIEKQRNAKSIRMIVGGLHMYEQTEAQIRPVVAQLQKLNVQSVVLGHCTGDLAMRLFRESYKERFSTAGAGKTIALE